MLYASSGNYQNMTGQMTNGDVPVCMVDCIPITGEKLVEPKQETEKDGRALAHEENNPKWLARKKNRSRASKNQTVLDSERRVGC